MKGETLKGHLNMLVLASLQSEPKHGYAVIEELRRSSGGVFDLPEGTVYPALHRLERAGLLTSRWSTAMGRRRRVYRLSRKGRAAMAQQKQDWKDFIHAVGGVLGEVT